MDWSKKTVIVCFRNRRKNTDAASYLKNAVGFLRVKHTYTLTNSALVEVAPNTLEDFIHDMRNYDDVEFCEYNYYVLPQSTNEHVGDWSVSSQWSCNAVRNVHGIGKNPASGINVKIAVIDSGLSPHPYLPAPSFYQSLSFIEQWDDDIKGHIQAVKEIRGIARQEGQSPSPLSSDASTSVWRSYLREADFHLRRFNEECWNAWLQLGGDWYQKTIPLYRSLQSQQSNNPPSGPSLPPVPPDINNMCGLLRRISLRSYNFVDDNLNVEDSHGHGTQMTGLMASRAGASYTEPDAIKKKLLEKYEADVLELVPFAELMILKCYDNSNIEESNVHAIIEALEHAHRYAADIVYCGLAFNPGPKGIPTKTALVLDRTIEALAQQEIPVICPAGNNGLPELEFPAACYAACAISAITQDKNKQLALCSYSNYANSQEEVCFTAYGGEGTDKVLTTNLNFGFSFTTGTSVAAAIGTGIIARFLSARKTRIRNNQYQDEMYKLLHAGTAPSSPIILTGARISLTQMISEAQTKTYRNIYTGKVPATQAIGNGLIREFL